MANHTESTARTGRSVRRVVVPGRWQLTANQRRVVNAHQVPVPDLTEEPEPAPAAGRPVATRTSSSVPAPARRTVG